MPVISTVKRELIAEFIQKGYVWENIADVMNVSLASINRIKSRMNAIPAEKILSKIELKALNYFLHENISMENSLKKFGLPAGTYSKFLKTIEYNEYMKKREENKSQVKRHKKISRIALNRYGFQDIRRLVLRDYYEKGMKIDNIVKKHKISRKVLFRII